MKRDCVTAWPISHFKCIQIYFTDSGIKNTAYDVKEYSISRYYYSMEA